jgi:hypothetical protein
VLLLIGIEVDLECRREALEKLGSDAVCNLHDVRVQQVVCISECRRLAQTAKYQYKYQYKNIFFLKLLHNVNAVFAVFGEIKTN